MTVRSTGRGASGRTGSFAGLVLVALLATMPLPFARADGPLRSGRIVGGQFLLLGPSSCLTTMDCAPWLVTCDPILTGRDPGLFSSIVDISEFARTERWLWLSSAWLAGNVEFWDEDCEGVGAFKPERYGHGFTVPARTVWMTIAAGAAPALSWELW